MSVSTADVAALLTSALGLGRSAQSFSDDTPLLGALPELDSMAVVTVMTHIEDQYGIRIEDDEISADTFASVGTLRQFLNDKLGA